MAGLGAACRLETREGLPALELAQEAEEEGLVPGSELTQEQEEDVEGLLEAEKSALPHLAGTETPSGPERRVLRVALGLGRLPLPLAPRCNAVTSSINNTFGAGPGSGVRMLSPHV